MVDIENLQNLKIFVMINGEDYIGYVSEDKKKTLTLDGACKLVAIHDIEYDEASSYRAIYNASVFSTDKRMTIRKDHIMTILTPSRQTVELWLSYVYPEEDIVEVELEEGAVAEHRADEGTHLTLV